MSRLQTLVEARKSIHDLFLENSKRVYQQNEIIEILEVNREQLGLPQRIKGPRFIRFLLREKILKAKQIKSFFSESGELKEVTIKYIQDVCSEYETAISLKKEAYFSHLTAIFLHDLITDEPKQMYVTYEQSMKDVTETDLSQENVDRAFAKPQRKPNYYVKIGTYRILLLNGMYTNRASLIKSETHQGLFYTNLERTLLDITVRPNYADGSENVLNIYKKVIGTFSEDNLISLLDHIPFVYPYQQAIGFYLERAGYKGPLISELKKRVTNLRFYLTYEMQDIKYSKEWKIYYPGKML